MSSGVEMLQSVISEHIVTYVVRLDTGTAESGGRAQHGIQQETTKDLAIFRLAYKDLMTLPQGQFDGEDIKVYELGTKTITTSSVIVFEGGNYRVQSNSDRNKDGGFTMYIAKFIGVNETSTE